MLEEEPNLLAEPRRGLFTYSSNLEWLKWTSEKNVEGAGPFQQMIDGAKKL